MILPDEAPPESPPAGDPLDRLRSYVLRESPSGDAAAIRAFAGEVVARLVSLGATAAWESHPTGDHAVCSFPGSAGREAEKPILLLLHADTVWPVGQLETMPWSNAAGVARGPGAFDMKGGIVIVEEALRLTADTPRRPITVLIVADEEVGSPSSRPLIERHAAGAHAALGFEPPHPDGALKTGRWGSTRLRIGVTGREAHAALDAASGISAIDELVDQLLVVRGIVDVPGVLCNVGVIGGGGRTNVIPGSASADLGLRFRDGEVEDEILGRLLALRPIRAGAVVEARIITNRPAWQPGALHDELLARIADAGRSRGQRIEGRPTTGAADTNLTGRLGVPTVDGLGPIGSGAHAVTEQIVVASLAERVELVAAILESL